MTGAFSPAALQRFSKRIAAQLGLHFPPERWRDLESGLRAMARKRGIEPTERDLERFWAHGFSRQDIEAVAGELTVGETYFFRDARTFGFLRERVIPELLADRRSRQHYLRIWSAGCCTGEEPYSIAILLDRYFPELSSWQVTILGTDVNTAFLQRAAQGVYGEWSFRDAPSWLKEHYFAPFPDRRYEVIPRIRQSVSFAYLNLAEGGFPSLANGTNACDLILCRNVLMYFTPERAHAVITGFQHALLDSGWLVVSAAELSPQLSAVLTPVVHAGGTYYRKPRAGAQPTTSEPACPAPARDGVEAGVPDVVPVARAANEPIPSPARDEAGECFGRGDYSGTVQLLEAAASSRRLGKQDLALLARACANLGRLAAARGWTEQALAADKLDAGLHYLRALVIEEEGDLAESAAGLRRALYLDPDFVLAHFELGNLARRRARRAEAVRHFANARRLLARRPPDEVLPHSDGLSAGRLKDAVDSALSEERAA